MKIKILFRGKRIDNEAWVEGSLLTTKYNTYIIPMYDEFVSYQKPISVDSETIGQFTGLTNKKGVKIFDGDVLLSESWSANARSKRKTHIVEWGRVGWLASGYNGDMVVKPSLDVKSDWQVIGNIHDNPELLK